MPRWPRRARRRIQAASRGSLPLGLGISEADLQGAFPARAPVPPKHFVVVCRCRSAQSHYDPATGQRHPGGLCACQHPIAGANCGCACAEGRGVWCGECRPIAAVEPPTEQEKQRAKAGLEALEREELEPLFAAAGEERGRTARLLQAAGLSGKAKRYAACGRMGFTVDCQEIDAHLFYRLFRCGMRFCPDCGPATMAALVDRHYPAIVGYVARQPTRRGTTLAHLTLTVRAHGDTPSSAEIRTFNRAVRKLFRLIEKGGLYQEGLGAVSSVRPGLIWCDEFGAEHKGKGGAAGGWNLHCHGIFYGPLLDWEKLRDAWEKLTGATGCFFRQIRGWNLRQTGNPKWRTELVRAVYYTLKYRAKAPSRSPERIAALESAFHRVRRFHAVGVFYRLPPAEGIAKAKTEPGCPICGGNLIIGYHPVPLNNPGLNGRRDIEMVAREARRARATEFQAETPPDERRRK